MKKYLKRLLTFILAVAMVATSIPVAAFAATNAGNFTDVDSDDYFYNPVKWAIEKKVTSGTSATTFSPKNDCTRGQIVTFLYKAGSGSPVSNAKTFSDVKKGKYYYDPVGWAVSRGITSGTTSDTFSPNQSCTRAQAVTFLWKFAGSPNADSSKFSDVKEGKYYYTAVSWAVSRGITAGTSEHEFSPNQTCTRAQIVTFLYKHFNANQNGNRHTKDSDSKENSVKITFDTNGGSKVESQTVKAGQLISLPEDPQKDNCTFIGWYTGKGYSDLFDFSKPVNSNTTVYAKWVDNTDHTDSDHDGLTDSLEKEFGTDPNSADTDGDGISDFIELNDLNTDPLNKDTDQEGKSDADKDSDNDGLTNKEEVGLGTNPASADADHDGLTDYEEVYVYHTDPLKVDTDGDQVLDGKEVLIGSDPTNAETSFTTEDSGEVLSEVNPVSASALVTTDAAGAGTLRIDEVTVADNILLSPAIPGYLGSAYNFSTDGAFESATITFSYDTSLGTISDDFQPRIYYYNEETQILEELENQNVEEGKVTASVPHFSTYILLNKVEFDKVWETEIKFSNEEQNHYSGVDVVFVIDSSGSMWSNDRNNIRKDAAKAFIDKLSSDDRGAVVDFDDYSSVYQDFTDDHVSLGEAVDRVNASGGTNFSAGINTAVDLFTNEGRDDAYKCIVFLTDGEDNYSRSLETYISGAVAENIAIYTIGLGSGVREDILKQIADGTGGKYYFASVADLLPDIYKEISVETIDYTTDSNNDGISDYYTKLLNDGMLVCGTGSSSLVGCTDMYGEDNDDWDGDGLKNGEEINITNQNGKVYVTFISNPLIKDTDSDGYDDLTEVRSMKTPPMKYTVSHASALNTLESDEYYGYAGVAEANDWITDINSVFTWQKKDKAKEQLIDYFYDYAPEETISKNGKKIAELKTKEQYVKIAEGLSNIAKTAKTAYFTLDDLKKASLDENDSKVKEFRGQLEKEQSELADATSDVLKDKKTFLDAINSRDLTLKDEPETSLTNVSNVQTILEKYDSLFKSTAKEDIFKDVTETLNTLTSTVSSAAKTIQTYKKFSQYMKLDVGFKDISDKYQKFLEKDKKVKVKTWVGVAIDAFDAGITIADTYNTYGKMKANRDAYVAYVNLLDYMSLNVSEKYASDAAEEIADIIRDESWKTYDNQIFAKNGQTIVFTSLKVVVDILADTNPYVFVAKLAYDVVKLAISVFGLNANAVMLVNCRTMKGISDACKHEVDGKITKDQSYFSFEYAMSAYIYSYIIQLAQSRMKGEKIVKDRLQAHDIAAVIGKWLGSDDKELDKQYKTTFENIRFFADQLGLNISDKLLEEVGLNAGTGSGSSGGGGSTW